MPLKLLLPRLLSSIALLLLAACSRDPGSGPVAVHWDRDSCERCRMVISDPHFAAEVRYFPPGKASRIALFDDLGCAMQWLKDKPWKDDPNTEIWVADHRSGHWLDARKARYVAVKSTPMDYGLGAQDTAAPVSLSLDQAAKHIEAVERRFDGQGLQPQAPTPAAGQTTQ